MPVAWCGAKPSQDINTLENVVWILKAAKRELSDPRPSTRFSEPRQHFFVHSLITGSLPLGIWAARAAEGTERSCGSKTAACGLRGRAGWGWAADRPVWSYTRSSCPEGAAEKGGRVSGLSSVSNTVRYLDFFFLVFKSKRNFIYNSIFSYICKDTDIDTVFLFLIIEGHRNNDMSWFTMALCKYKNNICQVHDNNNAHFLPVSKCPVLKTHETHKMGNRFPLQSTYRPLY